MIKILFFIPTLSGGGAEKVLRNLVNNMDQTLFDITVQTIFDEDPQKYLVSGIRYRSINKYKSTIARKVFHYWVRFCSEIGLIYPVYIKGSYDIEVAYLECGATKMLASSTNKKAKKIAWVHCDLLKNEGALQAFDRIKKYYDKFDKVICVSKQVKASFDKLYGDSDKSIVLYNVNDDKDIIRKMEAFEVPKKNIRIVSVGRISYEKGIDRLVEVCRRLKEERYDIEVLILGDGPEKHIIEKLLVKYELEDTIQLMGFVENPYPYMALADIIVCTSRYEGFSTVVTESMILGKAVVTTPCSGMDEILGESEYGLIVEDSVEGIYCGLKKLIESPDEVARYSLLAKQRGKEFSRDSLVKKTEDFFIKELTRK